MFGPFAFFFDDRDRWSSEYRASFSQRSSEEQTESGEAREPAEQGEVADWIANEAITSEVLSASEFDSYFLESESDTEADTDSHEENDVKIEDDGNHVEAKSPTSYLLNVELESRSINREYCTVVQKSDSDSSSSGAKTQECNVEKEA